MAESQPTVTDDLASSAPVNDAPLSLREGDEAIAALLGDLGDDPDPAERTEGDDPSADPVGEPDEDDLDPAALSEDVDDVPDEDEPDASPEFAEGRFAADDAKVKLEDGTTISIAELKRNNLFQRDYSKKTEEVAREREAVKAKEAEVSQVNEQLAKERDYALFAIEQFAPPEPARPTLSAAQDPMSWLQYQEDMGKYQVAVQAWQALHQGRQAETERTQKEQKAQHDAYIATERDALFEAIPILKDEGKRKAWFEGNWVKAQKHYGFTAEELNGITDHRVLKALNDANKYQEARAKAPTVQKQVQAKPVMVQGSGKRQNPDAIAQRNSQATVQRLRETGSVRDADAALLRFLK